jgi:gamma-glutamylcyclotransferase (GGCT)/AIG2-like uncharacterized protein YtfP
MYHFGYGSNLSIEFLQEELIPNAKFVMNGYLPNFEVQFPFWSPEKQAGYSGIMEAPGELVHGALYEVTEQELIKLDNMERVYKDRYKRMTYLVLGQDGEFHAAELYRVIEPKGPFPPERGYVDIMLKGARELKLDPEYIRKIEGFHDQVQQ